jgi:formylglycine-generating enzyme required for sulfatase activity
MMVIPAGSFEMGSRAGLTRSFRGIDPQTQVTLRAPLAVTRGPITLGQFRAFADETGHQTPGGCWRWDPQADRNVLAPELSWRSPGFPQEDDHPVVCVSWDDTQAYARWVSQRSGQRYRLPTEAEWEYAARAGTRTRWWWGEREADQCRYANGLDQRMVQVASIWSRYEVAPCDDGFAFTSPVTRFAANGFGLHDMGGNAWQWVEDCWQGSHAGAPNDASVAVTTENCASRVLRGGGWADSLQTLSAAHRFSYEPRIRHTALGFRLARTPGG